MIKFDSMVYFFVFFFAVALLANPVPQNLDDLVIEESYDVASSDLAPSNNPECTTSIPSTNLADDNINDSGDDEYIFRRGASTCPNMFLPTTEKKIPNTPYIPYIPATQRAPPSNTETKKKGNPSEPCPGTEYPKHVSCGGPEVRHPTTREILFVTNCVSGAAYEIEAHGPWEKKTKIAQYCCDQFLPAYPLYPAAYCKKKTLNIAMDQWTVDQMNEFKLQHPSGRGGS